MRLQVSGVEIRVSLLGRMSATDAGGTLTAPLSGENLWMLLDSDGFERANLQSLLAHCLAGLGRASWGTVTFWQQSRDAVLDAIQRMQGSPEMWAAVIEMEYYSALPEWAISDLGRDSALNRDLRLMYRAGLSTDEAGRQLRILVEAEQRRRDRFDSKAVA